MSSMRSIKKRISNVQSAEQIVKAMNMVASSKLYKIRAQLEGTRPMYEELKGIVEEVASIKEAQSHVFYEEKDVKSSLYVILTSDRGLSGGYNSNIIKKALEHMEQEEKNEKIFVVGSKGYENFKRLNKNIVRRVIDMADAQLYYGSKNISNRIREFYLCGRVDEVFICYTKFENVLTTVPVVEKLLPINGKADGESDMEDVYNNKKYEPSLNEYIEHVVPLYLHVSVFRALSESHTSEQAARMINMDAAAKNASELVEDLTSVYNRKRQAAITQELNEIVAGANILKKGGIDDR